MFHKNMYSVLFENRVNFNFMPNWKEKLQILENIYIMMKAKGLRQ